MTTAREGWFAAGVVAPAPEGRARGAPTLVSASTPTAIRAAIRSTIEALRSAPTSPRRTCSPTARTSWAQHATQATHAAKTKMHSASRGTGCHVCPRPPDNGLPTTRMSTAGTAVKASSAATAAPDDVEDVARTPLASAYPPAGPIVIV